MRVIITIGYSSYLLPTDAGVDKILKAFQKAIPVLYYNHSQRQILQSHNHTELELSTEYVPDNIPIVRDDPTKRKNVVPEMITEQLAGQRTLRLLPPVKAQGE